VPAQSPVFRDNLIADECAYESTRPRAAGGPGHPAESEKEDSATAAARSSRGT
jgi:hypothetical protein